MIHENITHRIIEAATNIHTALGAGLLESTYHACLEYEFRNSGLQYRHQVRLPVVYREVQLEAAYRIDFLVENCVVVEIKSVEKLLPLHTAQILSYLKLSGRKVGLLINFNVPHLRLGLKRVVNGFEMGPSPVSSASPVVESSEH